jgi:hypothetical protein
MDPQFKLVYLSVLSGAGVLLLLMCGFAVFLPSPMNDTQTRVLETLSHAFALCLGFLTGGYGSQRATARTRR